MDYQNRIARRAENSVESKSRKLANFNRREPTTLGPCVFVEYEPRWEATEIFLHTINLDDNEETIGGVTWPLRIQDKCESSFNLSHIELGVVDPGLAVYYTERVER